MLEPQRKKLLKGTLYGVAGHAFVVERNKRHIVVHVPKEHIKEVENRVNQTLPYAIRATIEPIKWWQSALCRITEPVVWRKHDRRTF